MRLHALRQTAVAVLGWLGAGASAGQSSDERGVPPKQDAPAHDTVIEWHSATATIQQLVRAAVASRHDVEKQRLQSVMARDHGVWSPSHPRYRLLDALHAFLRYHERQRGEVDRLRALYGLVSGGQRKFLEDHLEYSSRFKAIEQKLANNQHLCDDIVQASLRFYSIGMDELQKHIRDREAEGRQAERVSVSQTLKHIVRDWTEEGSRERDNTFACLRRTLEQLFADRNVDSGQDIKILLPGAGLGRLGHEISNLEGFEVTINEWSMYMNAAYRFLETQDTPLSHSFHPFVDGWSHHATDDNMHRALRFPDAAVDEQQVLMVEGDFATEFQACSGHYDVVLTYFFIDTARNLMSYLDTIKDVLKEGGIWLNLGPLLYGTGPLVQLSLQDIVTVSEKMGFEFLETDDKCGVPTFDKPTVRSIEASYTFDHKALTKNAYNAQFWAARKL